MKKQSRKELKNFGAINLNELDFAEDSLEIFILIENISEELQNRIDVEVEIQKLKYIKEWSGYSTEMQWSDRGINVDYFSLRVSIKKKVFSYELCYDFSDIENDTMWDGISFAVDLSEYEHELKKIIMKAMIDKFF